VRDLFAVLPEDFYDQFSAETCAIDVKFLDEPFGKSTDIPLPEPLERTYDERSFSKLVDLVHGRTDSGGTSTKAGDTNGFSMKYGTNDWSGSSGEAWKPDKVSAREDLTTDYRCECVSKNVP
jgi:hypothetical protein